MSEPGRSRLRWAELVATIGVVVSLVFVGLELRQSTAVARAQARNDLAALAQDWLLVLAQDSAANRSWTGHWYGDDEPGDVSATDASRARYMMIAFVRRLETIYFNHREGLIAEDALANYGMRSGAFDSPLFWAEFWPGLRETFDPDFVRFFESVHGR